MNAESKDKAEKAGFMARLFKLRHAEEEFWEPKPEDELESKPEALAAEPEIWPAPPVVEEPPPVELTVEPPAPEPEPAEARPSWWSRLRQGLARSSSSIGQGVADIFTKRKLSADMLEDLEDVLVRADLGVTAATRIAALVGKGRYDKQIAPEEVRTILADEVERILTPVARPLEVDGAKKPFVILVVGVNGSGKTTTIGKLAAKFTSEGKSLMLAAGDTFRAAAIEQLCIWGGRMNVPVIAREPGADAAGLAFDAIKAAQEQSIDILLMDTAGRLQNRTELMDELEKIVRVMKKVDAEAPHSVLLVLDATVGQNALNQVEIFGKVAGVTGLVMTKLDGTARGGILVAIAEKFGLPVHFIGVGEQADDLEPFTARDFARAIAGFDDETA
jgi:fused signal recognition particle receptor